MAIILPANTLSAGGYEVANSCRLNQADSPVMTRVNPSEDSTDQDEGTYSWWMKPTAESDTQYIIAVELSNERFLWYYNNNTFAGGYRGSSGSPDIDFTISPAAVFRDPAAWYHCVLTHDTDQATAANRLRFYVNNVEYTVTQSAELPSGTIMPQNKNGFDRTNLFATTAGGDNFDGYIAEFVFIDGQQLTPSSFAEADEDSPTIWKPKDVSDLTFGNLGYYLDFEASDNLGNDANGGTDLTEVNLAATDQSLDTPSNNFATLNPLDGNLLSTGTFKEGNTSWICTIDGASQSNVYPRVYSTIEVTSGKWYAELKYTDTDSCAATGISARTASSGTDYLGSNAYDYRYYHDGTKMNSNSSASYGDSYTDGDIIGIALDMDNLAVYFAKNGTWQDSGDPTSGASKTGAAYTITAPASTPNGSYKIGFAAQGFGSGVDGLFNFGSPAYANSSDAADGNGIGAFEYAPPSGFLALCTKNLGSDGG